MLVILECTGKEEYIALRTIRLESRNSNRTLTSACEAIDNQNTSLNFNNPSEGVWLTLKVGEVYNVEITPMELKKQVQS